MKEQKRILNQSEQVEVWNAIQERIEQLEEALEEIELCPEDDFAARYLRRKFVKEIPELKKLGEDILCAHRIEIFLREEDDVPPWDP